MRPAGAATAAARKIQVDAQMATRALAEARCATVPCTGAPGVGVDA